MSILLSPSTGLDDNESKDNIPPLFFDNKFFISDSDFKVNLGHYFGLDINNIDEDKSVSQYTGQKKGRPSVRNIISYLMQHQNLIANKHSLFYRFDEYEKREQTINQFKIFAGFVTQEYYKSHEKSNGI